MNYNFIIVCCFVLFCVLLLVVFSLSFKRSKDSQRKSLEKETYDVGIANITITSIDNLVVTKQIKGTVLNFRGESVLVFSAKKLFNEWCKDNVKQGLVLLTYHDQAVIYVPLDKIKDISVEFQKYEVVI